LNLPYFKSPFGIINLLNIALVFLIANLLCPKM
jgi:hypothetical protein